MKEFLQDISSFYWWLSVVIIGILVNLLADWLKKRGEKIQQTRSKKFKRDLPKKKGKRMNYMIIY